MMRVVWLASYPKSGNTWLRILLANLRGGDAPASINRLPRDAGIASARAPFDSATLLDSGQLTHDEVAALRPRVHRHLAAIPPDPALAAPEEDDAGIGAVRFIKTHDAYTHTPAGEPLLGGGAAASGVVLVVRDPRDIAASLAHHNDTSIDQAIAFLGDPAASYGARPGRQSQQLRQLLPGWSGFNASWLDQRDLPLHLVRYEHLLADTAGTLAGVLDFAGVPQPADRVARAVAHADFAELAAQEAAEGFREAQRGRFFRRGIAGGWRDELRPAQARRIVRAHGAMMQRLGYAAVDENEGQR